MVQHRRLQPGHDGGPLAHLDRLANEGMRFTDFSRDCVEGERKCRALTAVAQDPLGFRPSASRHSECNCRVCTLLGARLEHSIHRVLSALALLIAEIARFAIFSAFEPEC